MNLFPTMCTGLERNAEAFAEHTQAGIDRILDVSSKARSNPGTVSASLQQKGSPCADTGTAGVGVLESQYRARIYAYERLIEQLYDLMPENVDDAYDLVRAEYLAIHGPRG